MKLKSQVENTGKRKNNTAKILNSRTSFVFVFNSSQFSCKHLAFTFTGW